MKTYLEISVSVNQWQRELLIPRMVELGCEGFLETDSSLCGYVDKSRWTLDVSSSFENDLMQILQKESVEGTITIREIREKNWNEQWEKSLRPIEIGEKLVVKPSWCQYANVEGRVIIQIDPKMSFGTGYHASTRLILRLLERHLRHGDSLLDVGTGTGILAIAAAKLGAGAATGIDIDEWSIDNANENVRANCVAGNVRILHASPQKLANQRCDLLTANLTLNSNIELLEQFHLHLKNDGILLLSGFLSENQQTMTSKLIEHRFELIDDLSENAWAAVAARKR